MGAGRPGDPASSPPPAQGANPLPAGGWRCRVRELERLQLAPRLPRVPGADSALAAPGTLGALLNPRQPPPIDRLALQVWSRVGWDEGHVLHGYGVLGGWLPGLRFRAQSARGTARAQVPVGSLCAGSAKRGWRAGSR